MGGAGRNQRFETLLSGEPYRAAWRYACQLTGECQAAQDLLQDALLFALSRLDTLRDDARFTPWLLAIIRHRFIDQTRRQKARPRIADELPELAAGMPATAPQAWLADALNALHPAYRELLVLAYMEELDAGEIGQVLGISPRRASQQLSRARVALRNILLKGGKQSLKAGKAGASAEGGN